MNDRVQNALAGVSWNYPENDVGISHFFPVSEEDADEMRPKSVGKYDSTATTRYAEPLAQREMQLLADANENKPVIGDIE